MFYACTIMLSGVWALLLDCAALGQVAGRLALVLLINYFFRFHCPLSRHPHDVNTFPGFRTH